MYIGILLLIIGGLYLTKNLGLLDGLSYDVIWPTVVAVIGLFMILRRVRHGDGKCGSRWCLHCPSKK